jgi:chromosomal replication initiation ATPase DnaA
VNPLLTTVATEVAGEFGSRLSSILTPQRGLAEDARSRAIAMAVYRLVAPKKLNLTELGNVFDRDRTTVRHALERVHGFKRGERGFNGRFNKVVRNVRDKQ